jgi:hypothetical protein
MFVSLRHDQYYTSWEEFNIGVVLALNVCFLELSAYHDCSRKSYYLLMGISLENTTLPFADVTDVFSTSYGLFS